jgi:nucleotide-binding universal stress UspA family protein
MSVLVGYLPTPEGDAAFETGVREAALRSTRLVVLNSPHQGAPVDAAMADEPRLRAMSEKAAAAGVEVEVLQTPHHEDPVETLLTTATTVDAILIVIGLRRRSPVGKLFMGSTAQRLLLASDLPVLSVKSGVS